MDAIYENGTFWNCWSGDFVALCTEGPDFQQPRTSYPSECDGTYRSELRQFTLAV
uniref:Uncharacterized protein n=1 Tax=Equus asinus asinus TaxID=83772 RepID=A0A8C4PKD1_EQUAS